MNINTHNKTPDNPNIEQACVQYLSVSDEQLIDWVQNSELLLYTRCAWFIIHQRYQEKIMWQIKNKIYDNVEDTEDVFQQVWSIAAKKLPTDFVYEGKDLGAWFYRVTRNQISKHIAKKIRDKNIQASVLATSQLITESYSPFNNDDKRELLIEAMTHLKNPTYRKVVFLRYLYGLSNNEIAERLGKKPNTIAKTHQRALKHLRSILCTMMEDGNVR